MTIRKRQALRSRKSRKNFNDKSMKTKSILWLGMLIVAAIVFGSCSTEDLLGDGTDRYIKFKYGGKEYNISGELVQFTKVSETSYVVFGSNMSLHMLTISIEHAIEEGKTYDINCGTPSGSAAINVLFTGGMSTADQSDVGEAPRKIGELSITKKTAKHLSGTFYCKMLKGNITDGTFSAPLGDL
ncbi:MAG: hypothetical protein LBL58_14805 [Tannerellaceae bacterium]|nr:hypothetical protein [Tannerellaceae bacterium]